MRRRSCYGWLRLVIGVLLVVLGLYSFAHPMKALTGAVLLYGLAAVVVGVTDLVFYCKREQRIGVAPMAALVSGVLSVMTGLMLMLYPGAGDWAVLVLFPLWFLAHCVFRLIQLPYVRLRAGYGCYVAALVFNVIGLVLGFLMMLSPWLSFLSLNFVLGSYLILLGIDCIVEACSRIGGRW